MRHIAIALILLPLAGQAQVMKCPDGSYSDRCPGGEAFQGGEVSSYTAPEPQSFVPLPSGNRASTRGRDDSGSRNLSRTSLGPSSVAERARGMGISRNELVKARSQGIIMIGMEEKDVIDILGRPDDVDISRGSGASCKTMYWYDQNPGLANYVSMCGGRVDYYSKG